MASRARSIWSLVIRRRSRSFPSRVPGATYGDDLRAAITKMRGECEEGVIVFVDLLGGTPFNQSMMIANDVDKLEIVTGSNLPMIIELLFARNGATDVTALAEQAVTVGQQAVTRQSLASVMGAADEDTAEDGI